MVFISFQKAKVEEKQKDLLPHTRTSKRISVDEKAAVNSSLQELGSGIKLTGNLKSKFEEMVLKKVPANNEL